MSDIGAFESVFRRALREPYMYEKIKLEKVLIITDMEETTAKEFQEKVQGYFHVLGDIRGIHFQSLGKNDYAPWPQLKNRIKDLKPDLIVSYRMLWVNDISADKSLGSYIDLLSQDTQVPLLLMPHPKLYSLDKIIEEPDNVLIATEHAYEDHRQVNYALNFTHAGSVVTLVHIEDEDTFEYYMRAIEKIPNIDTQDTRITLHEQLLAGPKHYADSVIEVLAKERRRLRVKKHIEFGHLITSYRELMKTHTTDLLVCHTKDDTQLAMHSIGYSLAVEFRETPILLI